jgi:serine/threonine protein kinase
VAGIGIQVADALASAYAQGTLHRDIKPCNLLLDAQGVVWVADFGLAKASDSGDLTPAGEVVGALRSIPGRFKGQTDARDVNSLGLTLSELLTLRPAFAQGEGRQLIERILWDEPVRPGSSTRRCLATCRDARWMTYRNSRGFAACGWRHRFGRWGRGDHPDRRQRPSPVLLDPPAGTSPRPGTSSTSATSACRRACLAALARRN